MENSVLLSAIQPTGKLHIGNYLGAIVNWVDTQYNHDSSIFCIVDLHASTNVNSFASLREDTISSYIYYIASGIDPVKNTIFVQSGVPQHSELHWLLSCFTSIGWLNRMTQFKDKSAKNNNVNAGLFTYPILMAADILLYDATHVPVGDDQKQHLEMTCNIAKSINNQFNTQLFVEPKYIASKFCTRVMSLSDGNIKMSKSDLSDKSRINLTDTPDLIRKKIISAKTDNYDYLTIENLNKRPEMCNLVNIYSALSGNNREKICNNYINNVNFKNEISELIINKLFPIQSEAKKLQNDIGYIKDLILKSNDKASQIASIKMKKVKNIFGIL